MKAMSLTRKLARFVNSISYDALSPEVVEQAKLRILDSLGCAIAGRDRPFSQAAIELVKNYKGGGATLISTNSKIPAPEAAFANGVLSHAILQEDFVGIGHPSTMIVPGALALAEQEGCSGVEVITAVVLAYDIFARSFLGGSMYPGLRAGSILGPLGVATAAGKLLKLNEDQMTNCLGLGANFGMGFFECWAAGTEEAMYHAGMAARNGIIAALLARAGAIAAAAAMDGATGLYQAYTGKAPNVSAVTANLGKKYGIMDVTIKPYPGCAFVQIPIELAASLKDKYNIKPKDIDHVVEIVSPFEASVPGSDCVGPFTSQFQAQMSGPFCIAAGLLGRPTTSHAFYRDDYKDPEVHAMARKVKVVGEVGRTRQKLEIYLRNGQQYAAEQNKNFDRKLVPTRESMESKFKELATDFLGARKTGVIINSIANLEKMSNIQLLMAKLAK